MLPLYTTGVTVNMNVCRKDYVPLLCTASKVIKYIML